MASNFSARVAFHRGLCGLSQVALAERLGIHHTTVSCWESGVRAPGVNDLAGIARALNVTMAELFLPVPNTDG